MLPEKVKKCLSRMSGKLSRTVLRRGKGSNPFSLVDYDNIKIDNILEAFDIERSLSRKGNPYDNAVSEATNKILKIEFIYQNKFETLEDLELQLAEYIYWYNHIRIHGSLGYITPIEYRNKNGLEMVA